LYMCRFVTVNSTLIVSYAACALAHAYSVHTAYGRSRRC
jgi:hypothetical protein